MAKPLFWWSTLLFKILLTYSLFGVLIPPKAGWGEEGIWIDPWDEKKEKVNQLRAEKQTSSSLGQALTIGLLKFYREYISAVDSDKCPSYPSCSHYALEAVKKHGSLLGLIMTFDRLIHEADEVHWAPLININGKYRYYDPLENNDFWWYKK